MYHYYYYHYKSRRVENEVKNKRDAKLAASFLDLPEVFRGSQGRKKNVVCVETNVSTLRSVSFLYLTIVFLFLQ